MQSEYTAPFLGHIEYSFCQSYITRGIFRQFVYTIFAYSEQLIHHAISSQSSYRHQSSILQSSPVIISYHTNLTIYSPHLFTSYHIILISHYSLRYSPSCYSLSASFLTYSFLYISYHPLCPTALSYHPAIILTIHNLTFRFITFLIPHIPITLPHSTITITITTTLSLMFIIIITCPIFHPPISILLNILYIAHIRGNIPHTYPSSFSHHLKPLYFSYPFSQQ